MKKITMTIATIAMLTTSVFAYGYGTINTYNSNGTSSYTTINDYGYGGTVTTYNSNGTSSWGTYSSYGNTGSYSSYDSNGNSSYGTVYYYGN